MTSGTWAFLLLKLAVYGMWLFILRESFNFSWFILKYMYFFFQVFAIAAHLVYWGMATIVYPLCESNVYVVAPNSSVNV